MSNIEYRTNLKVVVPGDPQIMTKKTATIEAQSVVSIPSMKLPWKAIELYCCKVIEILCRRKLVSRESPEVAVSRPPSSIKKLIPDSISVYWAECYRNGSKVQRLPHSSTFSDFNS